MKRIHYKPFKDEDKKWWWNLIDEKDEAIAVSGKGYKTKAQCLKAIEKVKNQAAYAEVIE